MNVYVSQKVNIFTVDCWVFVLLTCFATIGMSQRTLATISTENRTPLPDWLAEIQCRPVCDFVVAAANNSEPLLRWGLNLEGIPGNIPIILRTSLKVCAKLVPNRLPVQVHQWISTHREQIESFCGRTGPRQQKKLTFLFMNCYCTTKNFEHSYFSNQMLGKCFYSSN